MQFNLWESVSMFKYFCLGTNDLARAARFYDATMAVLGYSRCDTSGEPGWEGWLGWGTYQNTARRNWRYGFAALSMAAPPPQGMAPWWDSGLIHGSKSMHFMGPR